MDSQQMPRLRLQLRRAYAHRVIFWTGILALSVRSTPSKLTSATPRRVLRAETTVWLGLARPRRFNVNVTQVITCLLGYALNVRQGQSNPLSAMTPALYVRLTRSCRMPIVWRQNVCHVQPMSPHTVMMAGLNVPVWLDLNSEGYVTFQIGQIRIPLRTVVGVRFFLASKPMSITSSVAVRRVHHDCFHLCGGPVKTIALQLVFHVSGQEVDEKCTSTPICNQV